MREKCHRDGGKWHLVASKVCHPFEFKAMTKMLRFDPPLYIDFLCLQSHDSVSVVVEAVNDVLVEHVASSCSNLRIYVKRIVHHTQKHLLNLPHPR